MKHNVERVGVIGLGKLGSAIVCRLLQSSKAPRVSIYNRSRERAETLAKQGALPAESPAEVASQSDVVLTIVTGCQDVRSVLLGPRGVLEGAKAGLIVVDVSTINSACSISLAAELQKKSVMMLDAPVTGSLHDAREGTLGFLVGGDPGALDRVRAMLLLIGKHIFHFGPNGAGCSAKLALNFLLGAMIQSLAESMAFLQAMGLSQHLFLEAVAMSGLSSPLFERTGKRGLTGDYEARFSLKDLVKDISLFEREAGSAGLDLTLLQSLYGILKQREKEYGAMDYSSLISAEERYINGKNPVGFTTGKSFL